MKARSWVEIDTKALKHNLGAFRKVVRTSKIMAVVKSNAYGHGMVECARILTQAGAIWFGVDDINEALDLRRAGLKLPILVLGYTLSSRFPEAVKHKISLTVSSIESLRHCLQSASWRSKLKIHLKLETGLNRQGITENELASMLVFCKRLQYRKIKIEGVYSHFAAAELADQKKYKDYCNKQMDNFERMAKLCETELGTVLIKHMADTAAAVWLPRSRYDLVRVGIGLYGLDPTSEVSRPLSRGRTLGSLKVRPLIPALSWYSIVTQVKEVKKGEPVGYNLTERVKQDSQIAIVPVGYWHGYPRALSGSGDRHLGGVALVKNKKCKVIGRVCMDMMMIDVTNVPGLKPGDVVTLIGPKLSAEEVATKAGTINYELVTRINPFLPRYFV